MYEIKLVNNEHESRLFGMGVFGAIFIDKFRVNIDDLLRARHPGAIVRCDRNPAECITFIPPSDEPAFGCVAGWISEGD